MVGRPGEYEFQTSRSEFEILDSFDQVAAGTVSWIEKRTYQVVHGSERVRADDGTTFDCRDYGIALKKDGVAGRRGDRAWTLYAGVADLGSTRLVRLWCAPESAIIKGRLQKVYETIRD